jgi:hypothetical protein
MLGDEDESREKKNRKDSKSKGLDKKYPGKDIPDESDDLMIQLANSQLRADYRKSLGKEHARRSWDFEIKRAVTVKRTESIKKSEKSEDSKEN